MQHYQEQLDTCAKRLREGTEDRESILKDIKYLRAALENCREPTIQPGPDTFNELFALRRFTDNECQHAPWFLNIAQTTVRDKFHYAAIPGGFLFFTLMIDMRGVRLTSVYLRRLTPESRGKVREAFKAALK
jgi:hypothetical protein